MKDDGFVERIARLSARHQIAFAASCCERLLPCFDAAYRVRGDTPPAVPGDALNEVWRHLAAGNEFAPTWARGLADRCEDLIPHGDECRSLWDSLAVNAGACFIAMLRLCEGPSRDALVDACTTALEAAREFASAVNAPEPNGPHDLYEQAVFGEPLAFEHAARGGAPVDDIKRRQTAFTRWLDALPLVVAERAGQEYDLARLEADPELTAATLDRIRARSRRVGIHPAGRRMTPDA